MHCSSCCCGARRGGSMRRGLRLFLPLTIVAATLVTAMVAAPPGFGAREPLTIEGALATMQNSAVIVSLLAVWMLAAVALTLLSGREIRYSSIEMRASALH